MDANDELESGAAEGNEDAKAATLDKEAKRREKERERQRNRRLRDGTSSTVLATDGDGRDQNERTTAGMSGAAKTAGKIGKFGKLLKWGGIALTVGMLVVPPVGLAAAGGALALAGGRMLLARGGMMAARHVGRKMLQRRVARGTLRIAGRAPGRGATQTVGRAGTRGRLRRLGSKIREAVQPIGRKIAGVVKELVDAGKDIMKSVASGMIGAVATGMDTKQGKTMRAARIRKQNETQTEGQAAEKTPQKDQDIESARGRGVEEQERDADVPEREQAEEREQGQEEERANDGPKRDERNQPTMMSR